MIRILIIVIIMIAIVSVLHVGVVGLGEVLVDDDLRTGKLHINLSNLKLVVWTNRISIEGAKKVKAVQQTSCLVVYVYVDFSCPKVVSRFRMWICLRGFSFLP